MMIDSRRVDDALVNEGFGRNLATLRKLRGYSQAAFATMVNLSRGTISNIESGVQAVQLHQTFRFAFALNVPVTELLPLMKDVITLEGSVDSAEKTFLEHARRQLIEIRATGDDDENT